MTSRASRSRGRNPQSLAPTPARRSGPSRARYHRASWRRFRRSTARSSRRTSGATSKMPPNGCRLRRTSSRCPSCARSRSSSRTRGRSSRRGSTPDRSSTRSCGAWSSRRPESMKSPAMKTGENLLAKLEIAERERVEKAQALHAERDRRGRHDQRGARGRGIKARVKAATKTGDAIDMHAIAAELHEDQSIAPSCAQRGCVPPMRPSRSSD